MFNLRQSGDITPKYFLDRAFFKKEIGERKRQIVIPEIEREILEINQGDEVDVVAVSPFEGVENIFIEDLSVSTNGRITIPKEEFEESRTLIDTGIIRRSIDVDRDIRQFIISKDASLGEDLVPNKHFLFNTGIFKDRATPVNPAETSTLVAFIPKIERNVLDINKGDSIYAVIIDGRNIIFRKRRILRFTVRDEGRITIPAARVRLAGYEDGGPLQFIVSKTPFSTFTDD